MQTEEEIFSEALRKLDRLAGFTIDKVESLYNGQDYLSEKILSLSVQVYNLQRKVKAFSSQRKSSPSTQQAIIKTKKRK